MKNKIKFNKDILKIDCKAEVERICDFIKSETSKMKRDGAVIGLSGGVDSATIAELCLQALGKDKILGLILPEKESNPISAEYAMLQAKKMGINTKTDDITSALEGLGTYQRRDSIIKNIFPGYNEKFSSKIVLPPDLLSNDAFNFFTLKITNDKGGTDSARLNNKQMREIVAATNTKQRTRMIYLYYYAEKYNYFVCGTTNHTELIQGFFVKYGDSGVDCEPMAYLYKMQVYKIAEYLGVIKEILERTPSPDTFSFPVSDEEMYFRIPYNILDLLLYAWENKISPEEAGKELELTTEQVKRAFRDFDSKFNATEYLRLPPLEMEK